MNTAFGVHPLGCPSHEVGESSSALKGGHQTLRRVDVLVIGSGFAGSLMAMIARRIGLSCALLERGRHPRFMIGESTTPLANLLLEEIATTYDLPAVLPLCKWGSWQKQTPHLACGLKRGFSFYQHRLGERFESDCDLRRQLLVGASPQPEIADTHWYRADLDEYLVRQAQALGVEYLDEVELATATEESKAMRVNGTRHGQPLAFSAELVIDATGPRGFLHRSLKLPEKSFTGFPATQALFSHFTGVGSLPSAGSDGRQPPYPPEDAAVHHIFDGGWIWVLKFNNGVTSAGVAATEALALNLQLRDGEPAWQRLLGCLPSLAEIFRPARMSFPMVWQPRLSFLSGALAGRRWVLLPSAAGFVDPLLSTGFPLTLLGLARLGRALRSDWGTASFINAIDSYARNTLVELETTAQLVSALYGTMDRFELFKALSLLYFAAASFSETARRLDKTKLAEGFLRCDNPTFAASARQICEQARLPLSPSQAKDLQRTIYEVIEPFDVAGLTDPSRDPWYPADPEDIVRNASKLGATQEETNVMLRRCGLRCNDMNRYLIVNGAPVSDPARCL